MFWLFQSCLRIIKRYKDGLLIFISCLFLAWLYSWIHEFAGHYLVARLSGVSASQMEVAWQTLFNIRFHPTAVYINGTIPRITYFAGGFVAMMFFLLLSTALYMKSKQGNSRGKYWEVAIFSLGLAFMGLTEFIYEGFFPNYHGKSILETILIFVSPTIPIVIIVWSRLSPKSSFHSNKARLPATPLAKCEQKGVR